MGCQSRAVRPGARPSRLYLQLGRNGHVQGEGGTIWRAIKLVRRSLQFINIPDADEENRQRLASELSW